MSKLKKHIQENRQAFDVYQTDVDSLWEGISTGIEKKSKRKWPVLKIAASLVILFLVGFALIRVASSSQKFDDGISLSDISPELAEAEFYYSRLVEEKFAMIHAANSALDPLITSEIELLDSAYLDLKNDLKDNMDNEEVINAMIQNYRIKLQILEQILESIETSNDEEKKNEEGFSI
jgi:hypothetical protein